MRQLDSFMDCQIPFENIHQALSKKILIRLFSKIFKKRRHQSDSMCQLPPTKSQILRKKRTLLWRQLSLKKSNLWNVASKKQIWQPCGTEAACTLFFICWPVSGDNDSSDPKVKILPCQHTRLWMAWSVEFCMRW